MSTRKHPPRNPGKSGRAGSNPAAASRRPKPRSASAAEGGKALKAPGLPAGSVGPGPLLVETAEVLDGPSALPSTDAAQSPAELPPQAEAPSPEPPSRPEQTPPSLLDLQVSMLDLYRQGAAASLAFWSSLLRPSPGSALQDERGLSRDRTQEPPPSSRRAE